MLKENNKIGTKAPAGSREARGRIRFSSSILPPLHVDKDGCSAKFWLRKVALADNLGFAKKELNELHGIVTQHRQHLLDQWNDYFSA